jgi:4-hydroxy-tetrahydrodipicolinate reductase
MIPVLVAGCAGQMGRQLVRALAGEDDLRLVAAVDKASVGEDAGAVAGCQPAGVVVSYDLAAAIDTASPHVGVVFTSPSAGMPTIRTLLSHRVAAVVGTTGFSAADLDEMETLCREHDTPALVASNFAIGAVLMMRFAAEAAPHFGQVEIIELHHDRKADAPSGTALRTAQAVTEATPEGSAPAGPEGAPSRGLPQGRVHIHSVRLPGLVAHQEVILGALGQTLTIRHDSLSRESFMPGVLLAIRRIRGLSGLTREVDSLL